MNRCCRRISWRSPSGWRTTTTTPSVTSSPRCCRRRRGAARRRTPAKTRSGNPWRAARSPCCGRRANARRSPVYAKPAARGAPNCVDSASNGGICWLWRRNTSRVAARTRQRRRLWRMAPPATQIRRKRRPSRRSPPRWAPRRYTCSTASPAAARPRCTCGSSPKWWAPALKPWCSSPRSRSRRKPWRVFRRGSPLLPRYIRRRRTGTASTLG